MSKTKLEVGNPDQSKAFKLLNQQVEWILGGLDEDGLKSYLVSVSFEGSFEEVVKAKDEEDAKEIANELLFECIEQNIDDLNIKVKEVL